MSNYELHLAVQFLEEKSSLVGNFWNQISSKMCKKLVFIGYLYLESYTVEYKFICTTLLHGIIQVIFEEHGPKSYAEY